jgi:hypothetical protein
MVRKMNIYTDGQHRIISIDEEPESFVYIYKLPKSPFPKHLTKEKILCYHYVIVNGEEKIYP